MSEVKKNADKQHLDTLLGQWINIIHQVGKADPLSQRCFNDTAPRRFEGDRLIVGYDPEFASELDRMQDSRARLALARAVERHLGFMPALAFEPLDPDDRKPLPADHPVSDNAADSTAELNGITKWYANPVVKTVVDAFNGEITDIRD